MRIAPTLQTDFYLTNSPQRHHSQNKSFTGVGDIMEKYHAARKSTWGFGLHLNSTRLYRETISQLETTCRNQEEIIANLLANQKGQVLEDVLKKIFQDNPEIAEKLVASLNK